MPLVSQVAALRAQSQRWRCAGERIALVPTMGNLHEGHLSLVREAKLHADRVIASIFVNPTQFGPGEDYERYPRTFEADRLALQAAGCDLLFAPTVAEMYPEGNAEGMVGLNPGPLGRQLCGAFRPGHFEGVLQVVARLFHQALPDVALFGEKDYQQLTLLRALARDLGFPVQVIGLPTVREADGLALSSRNQYLAADERQQAAQLHATLQQAAGELLAGAAVEGVEQAGYARLLKAGFRPDYLAVRRSEDLGTPTAGDRELRVLAAARLGTTRLIDNLAVTRAGQDGTVSVA
ncbi:MAG: pantoate--beta-alanine ligase [Xanthomonadales bacterium]|nr:pantoate--beta-alanine ligase [Xanthomonadales bacterium]